MHDPIFMIGQIGFAQLLVFFWLQEIVIQIWSYKLLCTTLTEISLHGLNKNLYLINYMCEPKLICMECQLHDQLYIYIKIINRN